MEIPVQRVVAEELKTQWKKLWRDRFDDRTRAEGIADKDYPSLFVERGTVIFATKTFKMLNFKEILQLNGIDDSGRFVSPSSSTGGWGKFIRTAIAGRKPSERVRRAQQYESQQKKPQQLRKGGRGWLHQS
jgi:hypothetical protein